jgi:RHS repeat-associated protein
MHWNWANQLAQTYSSSSAVARYAYGGDGLRVVKRFGSLSGSDLTPSKVTVYLPGGFEITGSFSGGALQVEWQSLAVMDDRACVARFEAKAVDGGAATGESAVLRYQVGNHLGSACLETSEAGQVLTREEYYAYGGTAYAFAASGAAGFSVKRYRYAGKECDSENGLYYFGARYFAAWLGRWTAGDPVFAAGRSAYEYCSGNPVSRVDPDGAADRNAGYGLFDLLRDALMPPLGPGGIDPSVAGARAAIGVVANVSRKAAELAKEVAIGPAATGSQSKAATAINTALSAVPVVGQVLDVRDTLVSAYQVAKSGGSAESLANFATSLAGWAPIAGEAAKAAGRSGLGREVRDAAVELAKQQSGFVGQDAGSGAGGEVDSPDGAGFASRAERVPVRTYPKIMPRRLPPPLARRHAMMAEARNSKAKKFSAFFS